MIKKYKKLSVVAKASLWALFSNLVQQGMSVLATPIFTRILSAEEFAQYTLYQSWHDIFIIFSTLYVFNYAIYSGLKKYEDDPLGFVATSQSLVTLLSILCFGIYYIVHIFLGDVIGFPLPIVVLMFLDILFFASFNIWAAKERYEFKYKLMTFLSVLIGILGPVFGLIAIHFSKNRGYGRIYGVAFVNILIGLCVYIYNFLKSKNRFDKRYLKFLLIYCIPLIPHFLANNILTKFDRIMIGNMCGDAKAGIYAVAYNLSCILLIVNDSVLKALTPWTYKKIKKGNNLKVLKKNVNYLIILVAVANIILILFAPEAIKIFATEEYYQAIYIIPAVSASVYFMFLFNVFANIEYYYEETRYVAFASIGAAVTNVILNYIFIKKFGYIAAGYTTLFSYILYSIGHFIFMKKVCKKHADGIDYYDNRTILIISVLFTLISLLIIPIYQNIIIRYVFIVVIVLLLAVNYKKIMKALKME